MGYSPRWGPVGADFHSSSALLKLVGTIFLSLLFPEGDDLYAFPLLISRAELLFAAGALPFASGVLVFVAVARRHLDCLAQGSGWEGLHSCIP